MASLLSALLADAGEQFGQDRIDDLKPSLEETASDLEVLRRFLLDPEDDV